MKKYIKIPIVIVVTFLTLLMSVWPVAALSDSGRAAGVNPVKADNVQLVKKVTLKGSAAKPAKRTEPASTGSIGDLLPESGTRYAIVIGISDYPGTENDLQYSDDDAIAMKDILQSKYGLMGGT